MKYPSGQPVLARVAVVAVCLLVPACGVAPEHEASNDNGLELTLVAPRQYSTPVSVTADGAPPLYRVTADVTIVFRFATQLTTFVIDLDDPVSGRRTHNEYDLATVAPELTRVSEGRREMRVPVTIPALGALEFTAVLIDHDGTRSDPEYGGFTVQAGFGADDTAQTQTTETGTTLQSVVP